MNPVAYRWRCQIQENAKQLAFNHQIPEMNHNEIVGWTLPNSQMSVILIQDSNENKQKRTIYIYIYIYCMKRTK